MYIYNENGKLIAVFNPPNIHWKSKTKFETL